MGYFLNIEIIRLGCLLTDLCSKLVRPFDFVELSALFILKSRLPHSEAMERQHSNLFLLIELYLVQMDNPFGAWSGDTTFPFVVA